MVGDGSRMLRRVVGVVVRGLLLLVGVGLIGLKMVPAWVKMVVKNVLVQRVWVKMLQEMTLLEVSMTAPG